MKLVAMTITDPAGSVDYSHLIQVLASTASQGVPGEAVQPIQNKLGCIRYSSTTSGASAQAAPQWPPPPPLSQFRLVIASSLGLDSSGDYLVSGSVGLPLIPWSGGTKPTSVSDLVPTLDRVQQTSELTNVDYHLFNVTGGQWSGKTLAIPVNPATYKLMARLATNGMFAFRHPKAAKAASPATKTRKKKSKSKKPSSKKVAPKKATPKKTGAKSRRVSPKAKGKKTTIRSKAKR